MLKHNRINCLLLLFLHGVKYNSLLAQVMQLLFFTQSTPIRLHNEHIIYKGKWQRFVPSSVERFQSRGSESFITQFVLDTTETSTLSTHFMSMCWGLCFQPHYWLLLSVNSMYSNKRMFSVCLSEIVGQMLGASFTQHYRMNGLGYRTDRLVEVARTEEWTACKGYILTPRGFWALPASYTYQNI